MTSEIQNTVDPEIIAALVLDGDLSKMNPARRTEYYRGLCQALGLNALTQPFRIIRTKEGKEVMYATRDCTEQLRKINSVSITSLSTQSMTGVFVVTANAKDGSGRTDSSTGAVTIEGLKGDNLANALMKAETKAKRRVTLSICGLGVLDETETETIPGVILNKEPVATEPPIIPAEVVEPTAAEAPQAHPTEDGLPSNEMTVAELHPIYMELLNEYGALIGMEKVTRYHPDNWKARDVKNYEAAIGELTYRIEKEKLNHTSLN